MTVIAYIDGDWLLYAAGFAGQKNKYVCPALFAQQEFDTLSQLKTDALPAEAGDENHPIYSRIVLDPDSHFFHSAKNMIQKNCEKIEEKFHERVKPILLMDGDGNFRSRIATIRPYKGNRSSASKPLKYNDIRQYLLDVWHAEVVHGQETDDEMAIRQTQNADKSIIVAVDKDMLQVPGWHLNPNKGFKKISKREGLERQYVQCITGDPTDNIAGAYKVGIKKAKPLIQACKTEADMWTSTIAVYSQTIKNNDDRLYKGLGPIEAATENMRLVYLRRERDQLWVAPDQR